MIFESLMDLGQVIASNVASCQTDDNTVSVSTSKAAELNGLKITR